MKSWIFIFINVVRVSRFEYSRIGWLKKFSSLQMSRSVQRMIPKTENMIVSGGLAGSPDMKSRGRVTAQLGGPDRGE